MSVVDSLKRLERAGSESSAATAKLCQAADSLAEYIVSLLPGQTWGINDLPRGWRHDGRFLIAPSYQVVEDDSLCGTDSEGDGQSDRQSSLWFAEAIATGWLGELAEWLEERTTQDTTAAETLKSAARTNPIL
jgi:hypothetical protein